MASFMLVPRGVFLQVFVTGCHRSGTSLLASLMHGLVTGQDPRERCGDLPLKLENPLGFFESERLVEINDSLLQILGSQWDRPPLLPAIWDKSPLLDLLQHQRSRLASYALEHSWVDKDPRLCITYPAYLHILLRRIPLVVALREPLAVATSLHARNGFSLNRGLVLWWVYNHHIASQLSSKDLLVPYSNLLALDNQTFQELLGPFLEKHKHNRPSKDFSNTLITSLLKPEYNRSEEALNDYNQAHIHPLLWDVCDKAYKKILQSSDHLTSFQEHFNFLPRVVLECSARDHLSPEAELTQLTNNLHSIESELQKVGSSLERRDRDFELLQLQIKGLQNSRSWKITAPLRSVGGFLRSMFK